MSASDGERVQPQDTDQPSTSLSTLWQLHVSLYSRAWGFWQERKTNEIVFQHAQEYEVRLTEYYAENAEEIEEEFADEAREEIDRQDRLQQVIDAAYNNQDKDVGMEIVDEILEAVKVKIKIESPGAETDAQGSEMVEVPDVGGLTTANVRELGPELPTATPKLELSPMAEKQHDRRIKGSETNREREQHD
ncbi:hypothetical protein PspLS_10387 [Pyricularia sp. CBS 133598]|nr:hypothetical protein PspLS_10387 [Pyricularia sp. CBS 133598]